jgi:hypothetical protein
MHTVNILTTNVLLILIVCEVFYAGKHIIGDFKGFFEVAKTFLTPKIVLSALNILSISHILLLF